MEHDHILLIYRIRPHSLNLMNTTTLSKSLQHNQVQYIFLTRSHSVIMSELFNCYKSVELKKKGLRRNEEYGRDKARRSHCTLTHMHNFFSLTFFFLISLFLLSIFLLMNSIKPMSVMIFFFIFKKVI